MEQKNKTRLKAIAFVVTILLANYIQITYLTYAQLEIVDFRCDAEYLGNQRYKADVNQEITFMYDANSYLSLALFLGDGTYLDYIEDSTVVHTYSIEGVYNVTFWIFGSGATFYDKEWLIIEVDNDAPEFEIGYTSGEFHDATYHFEDDYLEESPQEWTTYNNEKDFFLSDDTNLFPGVTIDGSVENLTTEDQTSWNIQCQWAGGNYRNIEIFLKFEETQNHELSPGLYQLFFSANDSMSLLGYNPALGENEILFNGNYSNGELITIASPENLELYASYYIENWNRKEVIEIDWFKLRKVYKGVEIVNDHHGYGKVIQLELGPSSHYCGITQSYTSQKYGTIEFWYSTKNSILGGSIRFGPSALEVIQINNKMFIGTQEISPLDSPIMNNTWYHLRIDFNIEGPVYQGLYSGEGRIFLDGLPSDFLIHLSVSNLNYLTFESNGTAYIDAIGYTWDEDYFIGKNYEKTVPEHLYEDLEITFSVINMEESDLDKTGFSYERETEIEENYQYIWDFGDGNFSYEESPTYKFSNTGEYPVRVTLIDDQGAMTTEVKNFLIENKEPETDIVYGLNYDATYDFKYDISEQPPSEWITHGNVQVVDFKDEYSKVVEIDTTNGGYGMIRIPEPSLNLNGSMEFWIYFTDIENDEFFFWVDKLDPNDENLFVLKNSTRFGFLNGKWMYYYTYKGAGNVDKYAYGEMTELPLPVNNEWTHIRFDYCWSDQLEYNSLTGKEWQVYINGFSSNIYQGAGKEFNRKGFDIRAGSKIYLESIGFTTDSDYNLGDNNPERLETYYGTWDFRFYPNGPIPFDETLQSTILGPWAFGSYNFEKIANNCSANIISELDGHQKVLELQDNNASDLVFASLIDLAESTFGTIEFWLRTTDTSQGLVIALGYEIFHSGIWLGEDGKWWYKNGDQYLEIPDVPKMLNNTWHHVRIDFNCTSNQFSFGVDGNYSRLGPFNFDYDVDNFGWNIWSTVHEGYNYSIFLDAIGGSWDPAYEIGDNVNAREAVYSDTEIIFSADSTDTETDQENLQYLWNFGDNQTGFGQTVLHSFSRAGKYKVKLIAIDDNAEFEIAEKYIWIDNVYPSIDITEITYGKTSYDFTHDNIGEFPNGWYKSDLEELIANFTQVVNNVDIFSNVVLIGNGSGVGGIWTSDVNGLPFNQTDPGELSLFNGTIEFWIYTTDILKSQLYISFFQDTYLDGIYIEFVNGTWTHDGVEIEFDTLWTMQSNSWTHFRIDFCCDSNSYMGLGNDEFIIYADGHASQNLNMIYNKHLDISNLTCFGVFTQMYQNETIKVYVDNFGFSWDPEYQVGDNEFKYIQYRFNEGETIILDCMSYDTYTDYQRLIYNWGDLYMNIGEWQDLGWHYSYTFMDNDDGDELEGYPIVSFVGDPLYMWDLDSYYIEVDNVLPEFNVHTAKVVSNVSLSIFNDSNEAANFTIYLQSLYSNQTVFNIPYTSDYSGDWVNFNWTMIEMLASYEWDLVVNQTGREGGEHIVQLNFEYENGFELEEYHIFDGGSTLWIIDLDDQWTESAQELSNVPVTFVGTVTDPSNDKVELEINYIIKYIHEVSSDTPLIQTNFTVSHVPNNIHWSYQIIENGPNKYAVNEFTAAIPNDWSEKLMSGDFPVAYDVIFKADLTDVDFDDLINNLFTTEGVSVLGFDSIIYYINGNYNEFEGYSIAQNFNLNFSISDNFEFSDLAPAIKIHAPINITEDQTITYFADVIDINADNVTVGMSYGINDGTGLFYHEAKDLGNNRFGVNYTYINEGKYLLNVIASDGNSQSKALHLINVVNQVPFAKIRTYQNETVQDELIKFTADIYDTGSDINSIRYFWDFGDGVFSAEESPLHAYFQTGKYTVKLNIKDDNGAKFTAIYNISVIDEPPEIYGPFSFTGAEGQTIILDVDISDSIIDFEMTYQWDISKSIKIYNSTYNFMAIDEGDIPGTPFEFTTVNDVQYEVIDELAGHIKVLEMKDNNDILNGSWNIRYGDSGSVNGSIEFWLRSSHISIDEDNFAIKVLQYGSGMMPIVVSDNGTWVYRNIFTENQSIIPNIPKLTSNTWHHIRIDYECSNGKYSGLEENQWRIIVDGVSSPILDLQMGNFPNDDVSYLDCLEITSGNHNNMSIYCDAIGYYNGLTQYDLGENTFQVFDGYSFIKTIYGKKPSIAFEEGSYLINLRVENNLFTEVAISVDVESITPILVVPNKKYYGGTGYIDITAYAWDSIKDSSSLEFEWLVNGKRVFTESGTLSSTVNIFCNASGLIKGYVTVRDSADLSASSEFSVNVFMDKNGDGYTNEYELLNNMTTIDMDSDGLPNFYEELTVGTNKTLWDTDDDLLSDGYSSDILSGELAIGTDPLDNDTDDDFLFDGLEWFGWNHTIRTTSGTFVAYYSSNPLKVDTDGDSLNDYEEYIYKTDPRSPDTDHDGLLDAFEIYEYRSRPTDPDSDGDGLSDGLEYELGTNSNKTDTDDDGIEDGVEYHGWNFKTNPLTKDTDHDFKVDSSETHLINYEIDGKKSVENPVELVFSRRNVDQAETASISFLLTYGELTLPEELSEFRLQIFRVDTSLIIYDEVLNIYENERYFGKNIDIKEMIEDSGRSYSGIYVLKVSYAKYPHGELTLESFEISVNRYLDPTDNDFDNDGILDGVETELKVEGIAIEEYSDLLNITVDTNSTTYDRFKFQIDDIGIINDADIYFSLASNDTLLGNGSVAVTVIQDELDNRVEDRMIYYSNISFSTNDNFLNNYHVEPIGYYPYIYSGIYYVILDIYSSNENDVFNVINREIQTDGYRAATSTDTRAWITKPDLSDTDNDGWSDYYEINRAEQTNPLQWDTDGDGVTDSKDIDPLYDIILEVMLDEGHIGDLPGWYVLSEDRPIMQMTASFYQDGDYVTYVTTHSRGSKDTEEAGILKLKYKGTAEFGHKYYIPIEDDIYQFILGVSLWDEGLGGQDVFWDTLKMTYSYTFNILQMVRDIPESVKGTSGDNWVQFELTKRGLSRVNTIALYGNSTVFNGHYNQPSRMHIFHINVTDTAPSSSPFEGILETKPGENVLLIPTSVYSKTLLSQLIQNATALENSFLSNGEFISLDRENLPETASNNIESIFIISCTIAQAEEILYLATWGLVNETTGEIGLINFYSSTKKDNFRAEMMNLHPDILRLIPLFNNYKNSAQGSMPKEAGEWWADLAKSIIPFLILLLKAIMDLIVSIIKAFVDAILDILTLILKSLLFILIWAMFIISWAIVLLLFWGITAALWGLSFIQNFIQLKYTGDYVWNNKSEATLPNIFDVTLGFNRVDVYNDFMGVELPTLRSYINLDVYLSNFPIGNMSDVGIAFEFRYNFLLLEIEVTEWPIEEAIWGSNDDIGQILIHMGNTMALCGAIFGLIGSVLAISDPATGKGKAAIAIAGLVFGVIGFSAGSILPAIEYDKEEEFFKGVGFGLIISGIVAIKSKKWRDEFDGDDIEEVGQSIKDAKKKFKKIKNFLKYVIGYTIGKIFKEDIFVQTVLSLSTGIFALKGGAITFSFIVDETTRQIATYGTGFVCFILGLVFLTMGFSEDE